MRNIGAIIVFVLIAGLIGGAVYLGHSIDHPVSQSEKMVGTLNLTSIVVSPYRVSIPVNVTSQNLTVSAIHSQNGSSSGAMRVVTNNLSYTSKNTDVAVISADGLIKGVSVGSTTVTIAYTEGTVTKTFDLPVTVTAAPAPATTPGT